MTTLWGVYVDGALQIPPLEEREDAENFASAWNTAFTGEPWFYVEPIEVDPP